MTPIITGAIITGGATILATLILIIYYKKSKDKPTPKSKPEEKVEPKPRPEQVLSPDKIREVFEKNLPMHARTIVKRYYLGLQVQCSGKLEDVEETNGTLKVTIKMLTAFPLLFLAFANFNKPWPKILENLNIGSYIEVSGKIESVTEDWVSLAKAKLIKPHNK